MGKTMFIYTIGGIIFLIFTISVFKYQSQIDYSKDFWSILKSVSGLMVVWYGVAWLLYSFFASDTNKTETRKYSYSNGRSFSITRETGDIISGDEDLGKSVFKIWWFLFPVYFSFWGRIKAFWKYDITAHSNLNLIIHIAVISGSFILFVYTLFKLDQKPIPRLIIRIFMYGILCLYAILIIVGIIKWSLN